MTGRLAAAAKAAEVGYAIEPDDGPSGKLDHWAIAGIPAEVTELFSKRSAETRRNSEPPASFLPGDPACRPIRVPAAVRGPPHQCSLPSRQSKRSQPASRTAASNLSPKRRSHGTLLKTSRTSADVVACGSQLEL